MAPSGTAKSPAFDLAVHAVNRRQRKIITAHNTELKQYKEELQKWKSLEAKGNEPVAPTPHDHPLCQDATIEAIADRLSHTPRGTLLAREELSGWFESFTRYNTSTDVDQWLKMYGAREIKVDRKTGDRTTIWIPYANVSVSGTIQPDVLREALKPAMYKNGLASRLLTVMPVCNARKWTDDVISDQAKEALLDLFEGLYELKMENSEDGPDPIMVDLNDDARDAYKVFHDDLNQQIMSWDENDKAVGSKIVGCAARLALIWHCVRLVTGEKESDYIDEQDMSDGIDLARWFCDQVRYTYDLLGEGKTDQERRKLRDWIADQEHPVTVRDLMRGPAKYKKSADVAEEALQRIVDKKEGCWVPIPSTERGGRSTRAIVLKGDPLYTDDRDASQILNGNDDDVSPDNGESDPEIRLAS